MALSAQQVKWASQHDWYVREQVWGDVSSVVVAERNHSVELGYWEQEIEFSDFIELRNWAGY